MIPLTPEKPAIHVDIPAATTPAPPGDPPPTSSEPASNPAKSPSFTAAMQTFENIDQSIPKLKVISEQLSEFGSCVSSTNGSSGDENSEDGESSENGGFKTMNERKRNKKNKRKLKLTPGKDAFMKKANLVEGN